MDYVDESEVLSMADDQFHIDKNVFKVPFVCGCRDLGEALRRINEGAAMIRTKGEAGTGDIVQAVRHLRKLKTQIEELRQRLSDEVELETVKVEQVPDWFQKEASEMRVPVALLLETIMLGRLPVVTFAAGGIATPADAALMMAVLLSKQQCLGNHHSFICSWERMVYLSDRESSNLAIPRNALVPSFRR